MFSRGGACAVGRRVVTSVATPLPANRGLAATGDARAGITELRQRSGTGGSGFIAAFCAGLLTGYLFKRETQPLIVTGESCGEALSLLTWVVFGAYVAPKASQIMAPSVWFYALSSLSLVRMLPVWFSLAGSTLSAEPLVHRLVRPPWARVHRVRDTDTGCAVARGWHDHRVHYRLRCAERGIARHECIAGGAAAGAQRTRMRV